MTSGLGLAPGGFGPSSASSGEGAGEGEGAGVPKGLDPRAVDSLLHHPLRTSASSQTAGASIHSDRGVVSHRRHLPFCALSL